jgi:hypothetical protein
MSFRKWPSTNKKITNERIGEVMSRYDWSFLFYKVFYKQYESPLALQGWLTKMKQEEGLDLVSFSGEYFVFKPEKQESEE